MTDDKRDFLAAYHILKYPKCGTDDMKVADIERQCIAMKYLTAGKFESENMATILLRKGLQDYQTFIDNRNGVNNYWEQIRTRVPKTDNEPRKWSSGLNDVDVARNFVKPLLCQNDNTLPCQSTTISDKHVESITDSWKNQDKGTRHRKVNSQKQMLIPKNIDSCGTRSMEYNVTRNKESQLPSFTPQDKGNYQPSNQFCKQDSQTFPKTSKSTKLSNQQASHSVKFDSCSESKSALIKYNKPCVPTRGSSLKETSEEENSKKAFSSFKTAREELSVQQAKTNKPSLKKTLGGKPSVNSQFVCPMKKEKENVEQESSLDPSEMDDERLKNIEPKMVELIKNEIMDSKATISWDDIAGLEYAKKIIKEVVVYPILRPDIFTGLRRPPKGILLFGPPGTGKTLIGKCIASQSKSTFFSISASSLTSKWIGEGEKMVRALFAVARVYQPSVIFVDEIDSLLSQRSETEHESSRRLKTEFLVQLDGAATTEDDRILIVGATNRPQELDEAARRRLVKRLYVPLPEFQARRQIINNLLKTVPHSLAEDDIEKVAEQSEGYSGADMTNLCKEASMGPIRSIPFDQLENIRKEDVRKVTIQDFINALLHVRPSVSDSGLSVYVEWDSMYGTGTAQKYTK